MSTHTLAHALLLTGPTGVGKTTLAEVLAEHLTHGSGWNGSVVDHPDIWWEDGDEGTIGIDRIRWSGNDDDNSLQRHISLRPYLSDERLCLIARADRLTAQAANALLKVLEEPPPGVHIVLTTSIPDQLPATILSRCQLVRLSPVTVRDVEEWLVSRGIAPELAASAAVAGQGSPGQALSIASDPAWGQARQVAVDQFGKVITGDIVECYVVTTAIGNSREAAMTAVSVWQELCKAAVRKAAGVSVARHRQDAVVDALSGKGISSVVAVQERLMALEGALLANAAVRLALDVECVAIGRIVARAA